MIIGELFLLLEDHPFILCFEVLDSLECGFSFRLLLYQIGTCLCNALGLLKEFLAHLIELYDFLDTIQRNGSCELLPSKTHRRAATGNTVEPGGSQDCWWVLVPRATAAKLLVRTSDAGERACHLTYTWSGR
jgi:hypothetical protein